MRNKQTGFTLVELLVVLLIVVVGVGIVGVGWVANIVQMSRHINETLTGYEILRIAGIPVFPLGVVLGWIGIFS